MYTGRKSAQFDPNFDRQHFREQQKIGRHLNWPNFLSYSNFLPIILGSTQSQSKQTKAGNYNFFLLKRSKNSLYFTLTLSQHVSKQKTKLKTRELKVLNTFTPCQKYRLCISVLSYQSDLIAKLCSTIDHHRLSHHNHPIWFDQCVIFKI